MIQGTEQRYSKIEKTVLAIMVTARKLKNYFLAHKIIVKTHLHFRYILGKPDLLGRMTKWAVELSEYDIDF